MESTQERPDLCLLSWNILAPCWINASWYPSLFDIAADHRNRINKITSHILSLKKDIVLIQEAQEDTVQWLKEALDAHYMFFTAWNNPTAASVKNGLLTLIRKDWQYASTMTVISDILDLERGEAILIITIPSKNIHIVNVHLDYIDRLCQAKMVRDRCKVLLGTDNPMTIIAGDVNAEVEECMQFEWTEFQCVFLESDNQTRVSTHFADPVRTSKYVSVDHIFYNPQHVKLSQYGKAWNQPKGSLEDALKIYGSDHIYVWADFKFQTK